MIKSSSNSEYIEQHIRKLKTQEVLHSPQIEDALRKIPRHIFVESFFVYSEGRLVQYNRQDHISPSKYLDMVYSGSVLITKIKDNLPISSASATSTVVTMLEALEIQSNQRVLEIGTGTGYNAALLAHIVGRQECITTIDIQEDVLEDAKQNLRRLSYSALHILQGDGYLGYPSNGPFDRIIVTAGCETLSPFWTQQLIPNGIIVLPYKFGGADLLIKARKDKNHSQLIGNIVGVAGFMPLQSFHNLNTMPRKNGILPNVQTDAQIISLWPILQTNEDTVLSWWKTRRADFWFYLAMRDQRTVFFCWLRDFGLYDSTSGAAVILGHNQISIYGNNTLQHRLRDLFNDWCSIGMPRILDWNVRFKDDQGSYKAESFSFQSDSHTYSYTIHLDLD